MLGVLALKARGGIQDLGEKIHTILSRLRFYHEESESSIKTLDEGTPPSVGDFKPQSGGLFAKHDQNDDWSLPTVVTLLQ